MSNLCKKGLIIIDYGSQYTTLIAKRLRDMGIYSKIVSNAYKPSDDFHICGVILSGGPEKTTNNIHNLPNWISSLNVPVLGICYGMQLIVKHFGGKIRSFEGSEYGSNTIDIFEKSILFDNFTKDSKIWMSHEDDIVSLPKNFKIIAKSKNDIIAAISNENIRFYGLQFHPEVKHTLDGEIIFKNFINICKCEMGWTQSNILKNIISDIKNKVKNSKVIIAVSGGVDSTVTYKLLTQALESKNVQPVFIDTGLLRKNESLWIRSNFSKIDCKNLIVIDAKEIFLNNLKSVTDPEQKRKIIGKLFIDEFEKYSQDKNFKFLAQGTLYSDVIESAADGHGSKLIKSHHNVGGLPKNLKFNLIEPLKDLFKDEVRTLGKFLKIPDEMLSRHPFPGPGLAIRIIGNITKEKIEILKEADDIFINMLKIHQLYHKVWQSFLVILPVKSVGVMGDNRTYRYAVVIRSVDASDGMTANVSNLPMDFLLNVSNQIIRKVKKINRVVYDLTSKPPATIEWE